MSERIDGQPYRSPWESLFAAATPAPNGGYFLSHDQRLLYVVIDLVDAPRTFDAEHAAIGTIRRAIASLRPEFPSVEAGVTGAPALFSDELDAASHDGRMASVLALVLTLGLLLLAFRRLVTSSAILLVLALSLGWSLGVVTLIVGHLTIFSMMFASVVIGLGTDYGIYFLFRYREERVLGQTIVGALERTAARSGPAILLGALTAAVAFYILSIAEFRGIRDFGLISGTAILLAFLSMLTVFPAVLLLIERWQKAPRLRPVPGRRDARLLDMRTSGPSQSQVPALASLVRYPKSIVAATILVTGASLWAAPQVGFDYNLLNLQADGTESVVWERKAAAAAGRSVFAALSSAPSLATLEVKQAAFQRLSSVSDVQSALSVLPDQQAEKLAVLRRLATVADSIRPGPPRRPGSAGAHPVARHPAAPHGPGESEGAVPRGPPRRFSRSRAQRPGFSRGSEGTSAARSRSRSATTRRGSPRTSPSNGSGSSGPPGRRRSRSATFPRSCGGSSSARAGSCCSRSTPGSTSGIGQARSASSRSCGPSIRTSPASPSSAYESTRLIERTFRMGLAYAFVLVAGIAALMIRRVRETVLAMVPLILGTLWTVALMQVAGLKFNLVNVWALPLIIGSAAEYGVNIVLRYLESPAHGGGPRLARSTVMGVVFNGLTTIAGFGSLLVAHHRGVWSLGLLLVIGSAATLAASLIVLPTLVHLAGEPLQSAGRPSGPRDRQCVDGTLRAAPVNCAQRCAAARSR